MNAALEAEAKVFDYRRSDRIALCVFGVVASFVLLVSLVYKISFDYPGGWVKLSASSEESLEFLGFFLLLVGALLVFGQMIRQCLLEKIVLQGGELTWVDSAGRERGRLRIVDIQEVSFHMRWPDGHYVVKGPDSSIRFTTGIRNFDELLALVR